MFYIYIKPNSRLCFCGGVATCNKGPAAPLNKEPLCLAPKPHNWGDDTTSTQGVFKRFAVCMQARGETLLVLKLRRTKREDPFHITALTVMIR